MCGWSWEWVGWLFFVIVDSYAIALFPFRMRRERVTRWGLFLWRGDHFIYKTPGLFLALLLEGGGSRCDGVRSALDIYFVQVMIHYD